MQVRRLEIHDARLLLSLRLTVDADSPGPQGHPAQRQHALHLEQIQLELANQNGATYGTFIQDTLVGAASIVPTPMVPNWFGLFGVAVDAEFRGRQIGRILVNRCLAYAASREAQGVTLVVNVPNPAAKSLYETLGFEIWSTAEHVYVYEGIQYDELSMRKTLSNIERPHFTRPTCC